MKNKIVSFLLFSGGCAVGFLAAQENNIKSNQQKLSSNLIDHKSFFDVNLEFPVTTGPINDLVQGDFFKSDISDFNNIKSIEYSNGKQSLRKHQVIVLSGNENISGKKNQLIISDFPINDRNLRTDNNKDFHMRLNFISEYIVHIEYERK